MTTHKIQLKIMILILILVSTFQNLKSQELDGADNKKIYRHSIEISPISPIFDIYAVQYLYEIAPKNNLILGLAYTNVKYDFGRNHAPTLILGYRRYLWRSFHLEYQLWPAYNFFTNLMRQSTIMDSIYGMNLESVMNSILKLLKSLST